MKFATKPGKDGTPVALALILSDKDKENITAMGPDGSIYCSYNDSEDPNEIREWLVWLKSEEAKLNGDRP